MPVNSWKNRASSELLYKSNRAQVSMVYRHDKPCTWDVGRTLEEFVNHSPVARDLQILLMLVPTSRLVYQPINHGNLWSVA